MTAPLRAWRFFRFLEIREAEAFAKAGGIAVHDTGFPFRKWKLTAHIFAPGSDALVAAVRRIGGNPKWVQYPGHPTREHWDAFGAPLRNALGLVDNPDNVSWVER